MFNCTKPNNKFYGLYTSRNPKDKDISKLMAHIRTNSTKLLNLYVKNLLEFHHKKADIACAPLEPDKFRVRMPLLYN